MESIEDLEKDNQKLKDKIYKLETDQKERELKLKTLHADEMKYITEMNGHEVNLFKSRIKELEGIISFRRDASPYVSQVNSSFLGEWTPPGSHLNTRHYSSPGISRCSPPPESAVKNDSATNENKVKDLKTEIESLNEKKNELEIALHKMKKIVNHNLTNHKEATDRLKQ